MTAQEEFMKDLKGEKEDRFDILNAPLTDVPPAKEEEKEEGEEEQGEKPKEDEEVEQKGKETDDEFELIEGIRPRNRQERRKLERLSADRESAIFLQGKLAAREEAKSDVANTESDYLKSIERIYGTETPDAQLATELLKKAVVGARDDAKAQALAEMRAERQAELAKLAEADSQLDGFVEEVEAEHGIRLTEAQEKGYFQLMEKMSPKDRNGQVKEYADPLAVWEVYQERVKARGSGTNARAKQLSDRSMTQSGASKGSDLKDDASARFLKEQGII